MPIRIKVRHKGSISDKLGKLSPRAVKNAVKEPLARWTLATVKRQFTAQSDPYGKRWAPKKEPDGRRVLTGKTRKLRNDISRANTTRGFRIHARAPYASFHQDGRRRSGPDIPTRLIFPTESKGLPAMWRRQYSKIVRVELRKLIR